VCATLAEALADTTLVLGVSARRRDIVADVLTPPAAAIRLLTDAVGFHYVYDEATEQYAHPTGIVVLTPQGRTSKYIYGLDYGPRDLRLALVEATGGRIGTPVDSLLLYCFHYDPERGKYGLVLMNVMRLAGVVTVACIAGFILIMRRREKRAGK